MKLYNTIYGPVVEIKDHFYHAPLENWDALLQQDHLVKMLSPEKLIPFDHFKLTESVLLPPIQSQEVWGAGVTYSRSMQARMNESKETSSATFYDAIYQAERPELFFKATPHRVVGSGQKVRIRQDSVWNVPEPELTLAITPNAKIVGYTVGNDMGSRSIEGENPLYLPQAKIYDHCCAIGPGILLMEEALSKNTIIHAKIFRQQKCVFSDEVSISKMKRSFEELVQFLFRDNSFPAGCLLMTGTGIIPEDNFTLQRDDHIQITIDAIGTLNNMVE